MSLASFWDDVGIILALCFIDFLIFIDISEVYQGDIRGISPSLIPLKGPYSLFRFKFAGKFVIFRIFREMYFGDKTRFSETLFYEILSKFRSGGGYILANFRKIKSPKNVFYRRHTFRKISIKS